MAESDANFIWLHLPEEHDEPGLVTALRERGVLVRAGGSLGRPGALRVTVGTEPENLAVPRRAAPACVTAALSRTRVVC